MIVGHLTHPTIDTERCNCEIFALWFKARTTGSIIANISFCSLSEAGADDRSFHRFHSIFKFSSNCIAASVKGAVTKNP